MVDIRSCSGRLFLLGLWALWATRLRVVHKSTGLFCVVHQRLAVEALAFRIDEAERDVGKADEPFAVLGLGDRDRLTDQQPTDKDQLAAPLDLAILPHATHRAVLAIGRLAQCTRIATWRGPIERSRRPEVESLMRALDVELFAKAIEHALLLGQCRGGWVGGL